MTKDGVISGFRTLDPEYRIIPRRPCGDVVPQRRWWRRTQPSVTKFTAVSDGPWDRCARCGMWRDQDRLGPGMWLCAGEYGLCGMCHHVVMREIDRHARREASLNVYDYMESLSAGWPKRGLRSRGAEKVAAQTQQFCLPASSTEPLDDRPEPSTTITRPRGRGRGAECQSQHQSDLLNLG